METLVQQNFESDPGIMYKLGSIEAQLKAINEKLDSKVVSQDAEIATLKKEVGHLKEWRTWTIGAASAVSFIVGILTKVISWPNLN